MSQIPYGGGRPPQSSLGPPIRQRGKGSSSCVLWGLGGCGLIGLIVVICVVVSGVKIFNNAGIRKFIGSAMSAPLCAQKLIVIGAELKHYQQDHKGAYPAQLDDLAPTYGTKDSLVCSGEGMMMTYTLPPQNAPADTVVILVKSDAPSSFGGPKSRNGHNVQVSTTFEIKLLKDGRVDQDQITRTEFSP